MVHESLLGCRFNGPAAACARDVVSKRHSNRAVMLSNGTEWHVCCNLGKFCGCSFLCPGKLLSAALWFEIDRAAASGFATALVCCTHRVVGAPARFFVDEYHTPFYLPVLVAAHDVSLDVRRGARANVIVEVLLPVCYLSMHKLFLLLYLLLDAPVRSHHGLALARET